MDYRHKTVVTVLSSVRLRRACYHCASCARGVIPKDSEWDIVSTSFSPGVRRLMARVGGKEPFDEGRLDLQELAGIVVQTKQVERISETIGAQIEQIASRERRAALAGKVVLLHPVPKMYVAIGGTGVPMVPRETQGRPGKDETGQAKTREAKLGCVFTQTRLDHKGRPVRDEGSTSYVGAIESAQDFGRRIFTEAIRRAGRAVGMPPPPLRRLAAAIVLPLLQHAVLPHWATPRGFLVARGHSRLTRLLRSCRRDVLVACTGAGRAGPTSPGVGCGGASCRFGSDVWS